MYASPIVFRLDIEEAYRKSFTDHLYQTQSSRIHDLIDKYSLQENAGELIFVSKEYDLFTSDHSEDQESVKKVLEQIVNDFKDFTQVIDDALKTFSYYT